jgi:hypothetical protein
MFQVYLVPPTINKKIHYNKSLTIEAQREAKELGKDIDALLEKKADIGDV